MGVLRFPLLDKITGKLNPAVVPDLSGSYAPVASPALTGAPTVNGVAVALKRAVDPRAYNLTGGVDDSTALAACFADAAGGAVEWPQLQINTRATLTIPDHTEIRGSGPKGSVLASDQDIVMLRNVGGEEIALKNLKLSNSVTGARTNYDIEIVNPFKPVLEHLELALSQSATAKGGIHIFQTVGQPGDDKCFMPQLTDVWVRNGLVVIEDVTDGKVQNCYFWGTYTGAAGTVQLARASNWTFSNVDIVPPQGDAGGYLIGALSNLSILGGLMDGSYDTIMTGHGIKTSDFVRGLSVMGVKFYNLGRSGMKLTDVRRSAIVGNVFVQNNKADANYPDIDLYSAQGNTVIGNTHGAPNARTNKGLIYREDSGSSDNVIDYNDMEYNGGSHYYAVPVASWQPTSYLGRRNRPDVAWPWSGLQVKSSDYTITKDDLFNDQEFHGSAALTFTLPSAGSVHAGNKTTVKNTGTGTVTVQTVSSQTIDGLGTSLTLAPNRAITIESNGSGWQIIGGKAIAPSLLQCPLSTLATISATAWPTANMAIFQRITIPEARSYRYVPLRIDGQSGNYQVAVVRLSGTGLTTYTRVMNSGVIAVPAAGDQRIDLGATMLSAGEYAIAVWFDNTTATTRVASNSGVSSSRLAAETSSLSTGVPASGTLAWASTRFVGSLGLEADV